MNPKVGRARFRLIFDRLDGGVLLVLGIKILIPADGSERITEGKVN
jgi:hypothetical protein